MIYLLEDDDSIRDFVIYTLNSQGMEARGFERPSAFWEACAETPPDLLLLDVMLPEEDGLTILKKLRADGKTARLPIILLTAKSTEYDKVLGLDGGADDYVAKPFGMWVSLWMNVINVVGNGVLIFGFHRGVEGVAIPTLISRAVAAVAMVVLLRRPSLPLHLPEKFSFRHEKAIVKNILLLGVPNGVEGSMFQLGKLLLLSVVTAFGTASVAANAIANTIASFQILAPQSIGLGMVTVVSRCVGAGEFSDARTYTRKLMRWGYAAMIPFRMNGFFAQAAISRSSSTVLLPAGGCKFFRKGRPAASMSMATAKGSAVATSSIFC